MVGGTLKIPERLQRTIPIQRQGHHGRFLEGKTTTVHCHIIRMRPLPQPCSISQNPGKTTVLSVLPLIAALNVLPRKPILNGLDEA